jgi:exonuclease SbcC
MVPYSLSLKNFMCYRGEQQPLLFEGLHVTCLSGNNGAGKSALLDAITWALWGKARRSSDDDMIAQGENDMLVDLVFQLHTQYYRVIRRRERAASGKSSSGKSGLDVHVWEEQEARWKAIGAHTIRETQAIIDDLLRMKYETFINASFLVQGRADEFTRKLPAERKQVIADILDLRDYARLEERAKQRARHLADQVRVLDGEIKQVQQQADKLPLYEQLVEEAAAKENERHNTLEQATREKTAIDETVQHLEAKQARRAEIAERLKALRHDQQQHERELAELRAAIDEAETLIQRRAEIEQGTADLAAARSALTHLEELRPHYDQLSEQIRQHKDSIKDELRGLQSKRDMQEQDAQRLRSQVSTRPSLLSELEEVEQHIAALAPLEERLRQARQERAELDERISHANTLLLQRGEHTATIRQHQQSLEAKRDEHNRDILRLEQQLAEVSRWQAEHGEATAQRQRLETLNTALADLRAHEQQTAEQVGALGARFDQFKQRAEEIKKRQALLVETETTTCPLCGSDLGDHGTATIAAHYEQEIADLRDHYRAAKRDKETHEQELSRLRGEIEATQKQLADAQKVAARVEWLRQQLEQASTHQDNLMRARAEGASIEQQLATSDYAHDAREGLRAIEEELTSLGIEAPPPPESRPATKKTRAAKPTKREPSPLTPLEEQRAALQQQQTSLEQQLEARPTLESRAATLRQRLAEVEQAAASLPEVEQRIAHLHTAIEQGDFAHALREECRAIEAHREELGYSSTAHEAARARLNELTHWDDEAHRLHLAHNNLERDQRAHERITRLLERDQAEHNNLLREDALLEEAARELPAAQRRARECADKVTQQSRELETLRRDHYEKQAWRNQAREAARQLEHKQSEHRALVERRGVFDELADSLGKEGVQAMLIESAIPEIEREANRLLGRITSNQMHVRFEMQRSTKKGDPRETLDIHISDTFGTRDYQSFSGGEAMRINFAIRIALSRLLARRAGASLETLVIDEGFGVLDAEGRERFVETISSVQADFKCILVITHLEDLKERFSAVIQITRSGAGSSWEVAAAPLLS